MQLLPILIGAKVEISLARGCTMLLLPIVMRFVPVREALSANVRVDASNVGGLGTTGMVDDRFEDDMIC